MELGNKKSVIGWEYIIFTQVQEKYKIKVRGITFIWTLVKGK
jgi:hypothetical protein